MAEEKQRVTPDQNNLKARDVGLLLMTECSGATSRNRLKRLFRQIEDCKPKPANCPKIAYSRMEESVKAAIDKVWTVGMSWPDFQGVVHEKYDSRVDKQTVLQNLRREFQYNIETDPMLYKNRLESKMSDIDARLPDPEFYIKNRIYEGSPPRPTC